MNITNKNWERKMSIDNLPLELIQEIGKYLQIRDLLEKKMICKKFLEIPNWQFLLEKDWQDKTFPLDPEYKYRDYYKNHVDYQLVNKRKIWKPRIGQMIVIIYFGTKSVHEDVFKIKMVATTGSLVTKTTLENVLDGEIYKLYLHVGECKWIFCKTNVEKLHLGFIKTLDRKITIN